MPTKRKQFFIGIVLPLQVISAVLAWRDLERRTDSEVRGSKRAWRVLVTMNPGNALIYWLFGRC